MSDERLTNNKAPVRNNRVWWSFIAVPTTFVVTASTENEENKARPFYISVE